MYGTKDVPASWNKYGIHDWARTKSRKHANVAAFVTVALENTQKPGLNFLYGCMSFKAQTEPDDVALRILKAISPRVTAGATQYKWKELISARLTREGLERFVSDVTQLIHERRASLARFVPALVSPILSARRFMGFYMSHERPDLADIYRTCYGLPFRGVNPGKDGGVEWLNSLMVVDRTRPHHFKQDELDNDGLYRLGTSSFFLIVPDDKAPKPKASSSVHLYNFDLVRFQLAHWRNIPEKITETGAIERGPEKADDDIGNALMMLYHRGIPEAAELSYNEKLEAVSPGLQRLSERARESGGLSDPSEEIQWHLLSAHAKKQVRRGGPVSFDEDGNRIEW